MIALTRVVEVIERERRYQISITSEADEEERSIAEWIILMEHQLEKVKESVYYGRPEEAKNRIVKVTAMGTACMQFNKTEGGK